jgi:amylosucrase
VFPTTAPGNFTWLEDCHKIVMTFFYPYQWDLNYANPVVFVEMTDNMLNLANHGIDIIRIDAVPYIWKQLGTDCRNLPQVHNIVRIMRMICEIVCPGVLLLGEVVMEPVKVAPYFGTEEKPECHMLYNATMMCTTWSTVATRDVRLLRHQVEIMATLPRSYIWLNYIRCHDDIGWGLDFAYLSQFGQQEVPHKRFITDYLMGKVPWSLGRGESYNDDPITQDSRLCGTTASLCGVEAGLANEDPQALQLGVSCDLMLHAFVLTQSGIPMLYSGDEIGMLNDYGYHQDPHKWDDSRYIHRGDFAWNQARQRNNKNTVTGQIFQGLRQLEQIHAANSVFSADAEFWTVDTGSDNVLGLVRRNEDQRLLALFNFSEHPHQLSLREGGRYRDLVTDEVLTPRSISLPPYGFRWLLEE